MADKSNWRKKIHPSKLKPSNLQKPEAAEDRQERRSRHGLDVASWRRTIHVSRPNTPTTNKLEPPATGDDVDESRSEPGSEPSTPRLQSGTRPKLARYLSSYLAITAPSKPEDFPSEPWLESDVPYLEPPVDPIVALHSIHAHICRFPGQSLPAQHNGGLLRVFEDYKKIREEKERLQKLLKETLSGFKTAEKDWETSEGEYQAEIRRLELIIAKGDTGMASLMKARQNSIINRKGTFKKASVPSSLEPAFEFRSQEELDQEIVKQSRQVLLRRPASPSNQMAALSRQFSDVSTQDIPFGTPPSKERKFTLAKKVKSELNLLKLSFDRHASDASAGSAHSTFSTSVGDPLPDEIELSTFNLHNARVEGDALAALKDLAILVARRRGLSVEHFFPKLMSLLSGKDKDLSQRRVEHEDSIGLVPPRVDYHEQTPQRPLRHFRSQPLLSSSESCRRHFSFEPGDDQSDLFKGDQKALQTKSTTNLLSQRSSDPRAPLSKMRLESPMSSSTTLDAKMVKPSKIPSPLHSSILARVRRENSASSLQSLQTVHRTEFNQRRDSSSSILTAFRQSSFGTNRPMLSRSSSTSSLRHKDRRQTSRIRNNAIALAAARAAGKSKGDSSNLSEERNDRTGKQSKMSSDSSTSSEKTQTPSISNSANH